MSPQLESVQLLATVLNCLVLSAGVKMNCTTTIDVSYAYAHVKLPTGWFLIRGSEAAGCSQEEGPKKGFVMGSRTQGVQEILEKYI